MIIRGYEICAKADLFRANLRWANLRGADLRLADLRLADLRGADLRGVDLLPATFSWDDLVGTNIDWRGAYKCVPFWNR